MQMDSSPLSESDDSMSESTRVFNLKMEKEFVKAFPLRYASSPLYSNYSIRTVPIKGFQWDHLHLH